MPVDALFDDPDGVFDPAELDGGHPRASSFVTRAA